MNMNSCLATRTLDTFVDKSNTALLLTQRANNNNCATINHTYLRFNAAAQERYEKVCTLSCVLMLVWFVSI